MKSIFRVRTVSQSQCQDTNLNNETNELCNKPPEEILQLPKIKQLSEESSWGSILRLRSFSDPGKRPASIDKSRQNSRRVSELSGILDFSEEDSQSDKLSQFKQEVKCLDVPSFYDSDDFNYWKWLRARGYDIEKAKEMLKHHLEWRESCVYLPGVMNYTAPQEVLEQLKWKHLGYDPRGRPILCALAGRIDLHYLIQNQLFEDFKRYVQKLLELVQAISDEQRRLTGFGKVIVLLDVAGLTLAKVMNVEVVQYAIYLSKTFEANYPEFLYRAYIINSNWFFTTIYNVMKPFLSHETIEKVQIHGYDSKRYLSALTASIPIELIPEEYGGKGDSIEDFELIP